MNIHYLIDVFKRLNLEIFPMISNDVRDDADDEMYDGVDQNEFKEKKTLQTKATG